MTSLPFRAKRSAVDVVAGLLADRNSPISAMIEIADRCNEVCVHCYQVQGQKGEMTTEQLKGVLDELAELGVLFLTLSGGEPTLRRDFLDIVAHARLRKFAVKIYTNALTMTRELAARLGELAVQEVQISLYSTRAEAHDFVTRVPGSFEKVIAGTRYLREHGVAVVLKTPLMHFNADETEAYVALATSLGADYSFDSAGLDPREDGVRDPESFGLAKQQYLRVKQLHGRVAAASPKPLDHPVCGACTGDVHVEANGEMRPCTQLQVPVGHALEGIGAALRDNREALRIRSLTWADLHGCRDCDLRPYCYRCFQRARVEVGDAMAPYASACRRAAWSYEQRHGHVPTLQPGVDGRDPTVGPYRREGEHVFRAISDVVTERDDALAGAHSWVRVTPSEPGPQVEAGTLVQLRRPGKRPRIERIPSAADPGRVFDGGE